MTFLAAVSFEIDFQIFLKWNHTNGFMRSKGVDWIQFFPKVSFLTHSNVVKNLKDAKMPKNGSVQVSNH